MPTVLRVDGFSFRFYPNDHEPPHVHAWSGGDWVVVEIETQRVLRICGMRDPNVKRAKRIVGLYRAALLTAWAAFRTGKER